MEKKEPIDNAIKERKETVGISEDSLRIIFDSELMGLIFWDINGIITEANDFFMEMTGYTRQEFNERKIKWTDLTAPEYLSLDQMALEQLRKTGKTEALEKELIRKDKSRVSIIQGVITWKENNQDKYGAYNIIYNNVKSKKELEELTKEQEQKISEKTEQLDTAIKELEGLSYSVSHDLRAPLRAVNGYVHMLEDDYKNNLDTNGIRILHNIVKNAKKIGEQIDSILEFSRLGRKVFQPSLISINKVVDEVINELDSKNRLAKQISVYDLGMANADYSLLKEAFKKLIDNAIKFSSKKENPFIEIGLKKSDDNKTIYYIKDNGVGFDMSYSENLFKLFQRLHRQEEFEGAGTGLAIANRIILKHGGKIWAEGKVNEGATFYFTL